MNFSDTKLIVEEPFDSEEEEIVTEENIETVLDDIYSNNSQELFNGLHLLRVYLSKEEMMDQERIFTESVLKRLVELLSSQLKAVQFESVWVLTNLAADNSNDLSVLIDQGVCDPLIKLLDCKDHYLVQQSMWALTNLALDSNQIRGCLFKGKIVEPLLDLWSRVQKQPKFLIEDLIKLSFALSIETSNSHWNLMKDLLDPICEFFQSFDLSNKMDKYILEFLLQMAKCNSTTIEKIISYKLCKKLVHCLQSEKMKKMKTSIQIFSRISTHQSDYKQEIIDSGLLKILDILSNHPIRMIQKEIIWIITNLAQGTDFQIQKLFDYKIFESLMQSLLNQNKIISSQILYVFLQILEKDNDLFSYQLFQLGLIPQFTKFIKSCKAQVLIVLALKGIELLFISSDTWFLPNQTNHVKRQFRESGGTVILDSLLNSLNSNFLNQISNLKQYL
ncbi:importin alpha [Anaeramoeba flamelloides]|uniref:Importin alpha n=1 Tax=Anaeramoeba flamelloides TaxID=1746091 RepID=A0AAV8A6W0_9EUKA|nr:importin alpha [Anaeramoeba flamelloides]